MIDMSWVQHQIADKYGDSESDVRSCLHQMFEALGHLPHDLRNNALDEFQSLVHGLELLPDATYRPRHWVPAKQYHHLSDVARVRPDRFFRQGWKLNGRVGKIIAKRRGDVIIRFDRMVIDAPDEYRGVLTDFEIDLSEVDSPQKGHHPQ